MFCQDAQTKTISIVVIARAIRCTGYRLRSLNQRKENIRFPNRVNTLYQCENSFKPCTCINTWLWKRCACSVTGLVVLHEHQVPELHKTVAMWIVLRSTVWTKSWAAIEVDFRAWTTRTRVACLPEVVFVAKALNAIHWHANLLMPDGLGFIVGLVNRDP